MKIRRMRSRRNFNIYPILWSGIIIASIYILFRFATLSLSDNMGQAGSGFLELFMSNVLSKAMNSNTCVDSYVTGEVDKAGYLTDRLISENFALNQFVKDDTVLTVKAEEYTTYLNHYVSTVGDGENLEDLESNGDENLDYDALDTDSKEWDQEKDFGIYNIEVGHLSMEYILTNGALYNSDFGNLSDMTANITDFNQLQVGYLQGEVDYLESEDDNKSDEDISEVINPGASVEYTMEQMKDIDFLIRNFYIVDNSTKVTDTLFDAEILLGKDMTIKQTSDEPQILIYHTHSQEGYINSREGKETDTVVGVGSYLTKILKEEYGYNVIHDKTCYDIVDGKLDRNVAYNKAKEGIDKILKKYPSIEVVIDLHRDDGPGRYVTIDGKETARIMLFNGLSRNQNGPITYLKNPNLQDNLAFSLQIQLKSKVLYPDLFIRNYLKNYRYNMHVRPKCLLVELGTVNNTVKQAKNAMIPFAKVLDSVLQGE